MTNREKKPRVPDVDARLDEAIEESFPASDPPATAPMTVGRAGDASEGEPTTDERRPRAKRAEAQKR